jgi:hypothetical protein
MRCGRRTHAKAAPMSADRDGLASEAALQGALALDCSTLTLDCSLVDALERPSLLAEFFKEIGTDQNDKNWY